MSTEDVDDIVTAINGIGTEAIADAINSGSNRIEVVLKTISDDLTGRERRDESPSIRDGQQLIVNELKRVGQELNEFNASVDSMRSAMWSIAESLKQVVFVKRRKMGLANE
jgi:hypothetical protein